MPFQDLVSRESRDSGAANLDALGYIYISIALVHTIIVVLLFVILWHYKTTNSIRLRCFGNIVLTVSFLQIFSIFVLLAYPLNSLYKCGVEFWVMSTMLPFSMALFQASNIRLLSCYQEQIRLVQDCYLDGKQCAARQEKRPYVKWWSRQSCAKRTYLSVGIGVVVQLTVTLVLFFGSRRFHESYGFFSEYADATQCRRGFEWVPSIFWQLVWSTVAGPYILLRIRNIRDNHLWAWQTRIAIVACLPGTPLWLVFTFVNRPGIIKVNQYFVPAAWFLPGIIVMQVISSVFPILDAKRHQPPKPLTMHNGIAYTSQELVLPSPTTRDLYSMASLELQISKNLDPLLRWAAEKEFTAENIIFLRAVRDFKRKWFMALKRRGSLSMDEQRERYEDAALIWFKLVNPSTAKFNINIDYKTLKELEAHFEGLRYEPYDSDDNSIKSQNSRDSTKTEKSGNLVAPWENHGDRPKSLYSDRSSKLDTGDVVDRLYQLPITEISACGCAASPTIKAESHEENGESEDSNATAVEDETEEGHFHIPLGFSTNVFDRAFESVKNDVFRNTWVRYEAASLSDRKGGPLRPGKFLAAKGGKVESILMSAGPEANEVEGLRAVEKRKNHMWARIKAFARKLKEEL